MKKRFGFGVLSLLLVACLTLTVFADVKAATSDIMVDGSYLTDKETSEGSYPSKVERGEHLMDGVCSITKTGVGKIYVYSGTTANHTVDYVSTLLRVQRYNPETGNWGQVDFARVEDRNTYHVSTSKTLMVERGYYYRVLADHFAGMDAQQPYDYAYTFTDGIMIK